MSKSYTVQEAIQILQKHGYNQESGGKHIRMHKEGHTMVTLSFNPHSPLAQRQADNIRKSAGARLEELEAL